MKKMWTKAGACVGLPNAYRVSRAFEDLILNGWPEAPEAEAPEAEAPEAEAPEEDKCTTD